MTAKVSSLRVGTPTKSQGEFNCKYFNMFEPEDLSRYRELRQQDNDPSHGVQIELIRDFIKKTREEEYHGEEKHVSEEEIPYVYIEWWDKTPKRKKGDNDAETQAASAGWQD